MSFCTNESQQFSLFDNTALSDRSLTRFRQRCYDYVQTNGKDLLHDCVKNLAGKTAKLMSIDGRIRRMDSTHGRVEHP